MADTRDVFISYARGSMAAEAAALHIALGGDEGLAFLDTSDIDIGGRFPTEIAQALLDARVVVVFTEQRYFTRWYCLRELALALSPLALPHSVDPTRHIVVAVGPGYTPSHESLPPALVTTNWPRADQTSDLANLVRKALGTTPDSLRDRLGEARSQHSTAVLLEESLIPEAKGLSGVPTSTTGVPPSLRERFVGRADDLWRLHHCVTTGASRPPGRTVSVEATAGMGKTQLAAEYARRFGPSTFSGGIFWIDAESDVDRQLHSVWASLVNDVPPLQSLAASGIDLPCEVASALKRSVGSVLFVIDNVPEAAPGKPMPPLSKWCPALGDVSVVVTSRTRLSLVDAVVGVDLGTLPREASVILLSNGVDLGYLKDLSLERLCERVGDLPLALGILNRGLSARAISAADLSDEDNIPISPQLEACIVALRPHLPAASVRGVVESFLISYQRLSPPAQVLSRMLAELAVAPIPQALVEVLVRGGSGPPQLPYLSPQAFTELVVRSFVSPSESDQVPLYGSVHRLLGEFLRTQPLQRVPALLGLSGAMLRLFNDHPASDPSEWPLLDVCGPHVSHLLASVLPHAQPSDVLLLGFRFGQFLVLSGNPRAGVEVLGRILTLAKAGLGVMSREAIEVQTALAQGYHALEDNGQARALFAEIHRWFVDRYGDGHPETLKALHDFAGALASDGQPATAVPLAEQVVEGFRRLKPNNAGALAAALNLAGHALLTMEEFARARTYLEEALALERETSPNSEALATVESNLARAFVGLEDYERAIPLIEHIAVDRVARLGPTHPDTLRAQGNLADALSHTDRFGEGVALQRNSIEAAEQKFGRVSVLAAIAKSQLGTFLMRRGAAEELPEAVRVNEEALATLVKILPPAHNHVSIARNNLAHAYLMARRFKEAVCLFEECVTLLLETGPQTHSRLARALSALAQALITSGWEADAAMDRVEVLVKRRQDTVPEANRKDCAADDFKSPPKER